MNLVELMEAYKVAKLNLDIAKKAEEELKVALKAAMFAAGEKDIKDEAGYRYERIVQQRKKIEEEKLLEELRNRNLTNCIKVVPTVDEAETLAAVERGELPQETLAECLTITEVVTLKLTAPKGGKK